MAKTSTKLLSFLLAVVMMVSLVPFTAFAEGEPELISLTPTSDMEIHSQSVEGNTYTYAVDYWNNDFKFGMEYTEGATAKVTTNVGAEILPEGDVYTLPLRQMTEYTYYITLNNDLGEVTYTLKLSRLLNDEANLIGISGFDFSVVRSGDQWTVTGAEEGASIQIEPVFSFGTVAVIKNELGQRLVPDQNGKLTINRNTSLTVTVTAQNGMVENVYFVQILVEQGNNDCTLSGIDDAVKNGEVYVANTTHEKFLVNATVPAGATYKLYKDAACTELIVNHELTLTEETTTVYLQVTASDGETRSEAIKLTINTTNVADGESAPSNELPFGGIPELYVRGGFDFSINIDGLPTVLVPLEKGTTTYKLEAKAFGYDVALYGDEDHISLIRNNTEIKLDGGITIIYAQLSSDSDSFEAAIVIDVDMSTTYTDELTPWAADVVNALNDTGMGYLRGDAQGRFNGTKALSRYEMTALIMRMHGINKDFFRNYSVSYSDTIAGWAENYVKAAEKTGKIAGVAVGDKVEFQGSKSATRNQFMRVIMDSFCKGNYDKSVDAYYEENKDEIDSIVENKGLKDLDKVADWAKPGIYTAIAHGFLKGDNNGNVNPTAVITRNAAASIIYQMMNA